MDKLTASHVEESLSRDEIARHRGIRKYKRAHDEEGDMKDGTEMFLGARVVMRVNYHGTTKGYILAEVIDFLDDPSKFWSREDSVVVKVEFASQSSIASLVGRYRVGAVRKYSFRHGYEIVAVGASNWRKYLLGAKK